MELPGEFKLIADYLKPLAGPEGLDLGDDAALLTPPPGQQIVISTDAMVENVHFLPNTDPSLLARKLLRVNLSDLAAMGAAPLGYLLTLCLPKPTSAAWLRSFAAGLAQDQREFNIRLFGGDTTSTNGPVMLSVTILGSVVPGQAVRRSGARAGDLVYVTGTIGDGVLGLAAARGEIPDPDGYLAGRYRLPTPRNALKICGVASAAMDVSDGLIQEAGHIARASGLRLVLHAPAVPVSAQAQCFAERWEQILAGGDDYELLLTVPAAREARLHTDATAAGVKITRIGVCEAGAPDVVILDANGAPVTLGLTGWSHF